MVSGLPVTGMGQTQGFGVERWPGNQWTLGLIRFQPIHRFQARKQQRPAPIHLVADNQQAGVAEVDSNLMRAIRQRLALQQGAAGKPFPDFEDRHRALATLWIDAHHPGPHWVRREFGFDLKLAAAGMPCTSATYLLPAFSAPNRFTSATSTGLFFASTITPLVCSSRCAGINKFGHFPWPRPLRARCPRATASSGWGGPVAWVRSGEVSKPLGLSSASRCSSSYRTEISQNSCVAGEAEFDSSTHGRFERTRRFRSRWRASSHRARAPRPRVPDYSRRADKASALRCGDLNSYDRTTYTEPSSSPGGEDPQTPAYTVRVL